MSEQCCRLKAVIGTTRKNLDLRSFSIRPQPAMMKDLPTALEVSRGEIVAGTIIGLSTGLDNYQIKN